MAKESAAARAYTWIRNAILSGDIAEGTFLDEVALAESVHASRTPVREALRRLEAEHFIERIPQRGAFVRTLDAKEIREVYAARLLIESAVFSELCDRGLGVPQRVEGILQELHDLQGSNDWNALAQLDRNLHVALVSHLGNSVLTDMYAQLEPRHVNLGAKALARVPARIPTIEAEHRALVDAIRRGDKEAMVSTLRTHLREVDEVMASFPG